MSLDLGLGFVVLNFFWTGLGLVRLWVEPLWLAVGVALSVLWVKDLLQLPWKSPKFHFPRGLSPAMAGACLAVGLVYYGFLLIHGFLPETFYDSLNYFLGIPQFWLDRHGVTDDPGHLYSGFFHGGSLCFMYAFVLGGTEGAKILGVLVLGFCAILAGGWAHAKAGWQAGAVAGMAVLTFPLLYLNSGAVRVDGLLVFSMFLYFFCLEKALDCQASQWFAAAAVFAGWALSIKPPALAGIGAALLAAAWVYRASLWKTKTFWTALTGFFALEAGPWLLKNFTFTGDPFFPYAASWFNGRTLPDWGVQGLLGENQQFLPMGQGWWSVLTLPWRLSIPQAGDKQWLGPLFLGFSPALPALALGKGKSTKFLSLTAVLTVASGLCFSHMLRFWMPGFALALLLFSTIFFAEKEAAWGRLWASAVLGSAVLCFGSFLDLSAVYFDGAGLWSGRESREAYLNRMLPDSYEPLAQWTAENLPADARLLIVGDARGVYYGRPFEAQSVFDEPVLSQSARLAKDPSGILKRLRQMGITHLVVNIPEGMRVSTYQYDLNPLEWKKLDDFVRRGLKLLYWKNFQAVYEVEGGIGPSSGAPAVDPLSFFTPQAREFNRDIEARNYLGAQKALKEQLTLLPDDGYWQNEKSLLDKALKESIPALEPATKPQNKAI